MSYPSKKKIPFNIMLLSTVSALNDLSSEMILPLLPLLISNVGGSGIALGLIGGLRDSFANLLKLFFGYLSDKLGIRKLFIYIGYSTSFIFRFLLIWAKTWRVIFALVGLERIGKGIRTSPRDALIAESMPGQVGRGFGIHRAADSLGAIFGSLLVLLLLTYWQLSITTIIIISSCFAGCSLIPLWWVKEPEQVNYKPNNTIGIKVLSKELIIFIIIASLFALANMSYMFFVIHAKNILGNNSFSLPILLYCLFNIFYTLTAIPIGTLSDSIGRWIVITGGYTAMAITLLLFALAQDITLLTTAFIMYGIALGTVKVTQNALASDLSTPKQRATALGALDTATGIMTLFGGTITGILWERVDHQTVFYATSAVALFATMMLIFCKKYFIPFHENNMPKNKSLRSS